MWSLYQESLLDITDPFEYLFLYCDTRILNFSLYGLFLKSFLVFLWGGL